MEVNARDFNSFLDLCSYIEGHLGDDEKVIYVSNETERYFLVVSLAKYFCGYHDNVELVWSERTKSSDLNKYDIHVKIKGELDVLCWEFDYGRDRVLFSREIGGVEYYVVSSGVFNVWFIYRGIDSRVPIIVHGTYREILSDFENIFSF